MKRMLVLAGIATATSGLAVLPATVQANDVSIGVNIGAPPPPPYVVQAPPQLVVVPGTPVYYAPSLSFNFFAYGGHFYTNYNGGWFVTATYGGPWNYIAVESVPHPVLAVPVAYYKIPPGHMRGRGGPPPWAGHGRGHEH